MAYQEYPRLRFGTRLDAPHGAGPTPQRNDTKARGLKRRIAAWESLKSASGFHKPGSLKKSAPRGRK